jgi:hypothetical protein
MIRVVAAFFADAANQGDDARFSVIGGGLHSVETERFPLPLEIEAIVVGLRTDGPLGAGTLEMRFLDPDGGELARIAGELQIHHPNAVVGGPGHVDPLAERVLWVVLPLPELALAGPGIYRAEFSLDGERSPYLLPLVVSPLAPEAEGLHPN